MDDIFENAVGFEWDDGNADKNRIAHGVEYWECEQVFFNQPLLVIDDLKHSSEEKRWAAFGRSDAGTPVRGRFHDAREADSRDLRERHEPQGAQFL